MHLSPAQPRAHQQWPEAAREGRGAGPIGAWSEWPSGRLGLFPTTAAGGAGTKWRETPGEPPAQREQLPPRATCAHLQFEHALYAVTNLMEISCACCFTSKKMRRECTFHCLPTAFTAQSSSLNIPAMVSCAFCMHGHECIVTSTSDGQSIQVVLHSTCARQASPKLADSSKKGPPAACRPCSEGPCPTSCGHYDALIAMDTYTHQKPSLHCAAEG